MMVMYTVLVWVLEGQNNFFVYESIRFRTDVISGVRNQT